MQKRLAYPYVRITDNFFKREEVIPLGDSDLRFQAIVSVCSGNEGIAVDFIAKVPCKSAPQHKRVYIRKTTGLMKSLAEGSAVLRRYRKKALDNVRLDAL